MANNINWGKIYESTYWGNGVTDNTISWGKSYADLAGIVPSLVNEFVSRVEADGGSVESTQCLSTDLTFLVNNPEPVAFTGLLNDYSGAAAAYSLRLLDNTYSGSAIRVRRASDNAEQDIAFSNNELDTATLETFASGTDAFVTTWYDQSGNGNDATQTTASAQPKIVSSGSTILENGKPSMQPVNGQNLKSIISLTTNNTIFQVDTRGNTTSNYYIPNRGGSNGAYYWYQTYNSGGTSLGSNMGNPDFYVNGSLFTGTTQGDAWNFDTGSQRILTSLNLNLSTWTAYEFQYGVGDNNHLSFQERIIYTSDQSSNQSGIETNINDFYSIY